MQHRQPTDDGGTNEAVPVARESKETGPISTELLAQATASGLGMVAPVHAMDPDRFLDAVAEKLADRVAKKNGSNSGDGGGPPKKYFLGVAIADWVKIVVGWAAAALIFAGTWYLSVRDGLGKRPTRKETRQLLIDGMKQHGQLPHPPTAKRLKILEDGQVQMQKVLIRQEGIDTRQTEILQEIKVDVKQLRRQRRR